MSERTLPERADEAQAGTPAPGLHSEEELVEYLEADQLVVATFRPVPPARLGRAAVLGLWALRSFAVIVSLMVVYTFAAQLH